jgi:biopolymer transport protein ExbB/TolQ
MNSSAAPISLPAWIIATQWASRGVLILLAALSVWSVAIMVDRRRALKSEGSDLLGKARALIEAADWKSLRTWATQAAAPTNADTSVRVPAGALLSALSVITVNGSNEPNPAVSSTEPVDRAVRSYLATERARLEEGLTALATMGSNAPFIGLFGTVLGIIQAFGALAAQSSNTQSVMTGISEALVATAVGLFVAIPAVIAYNIFSRRLRVLLVESEALRDSLLARLGQQWNAGGGASHGR